MIKYNRVDGHFWVRIFGRGILVKDVTGPSARHSLTFSERYGHVRFIMLGKWLIRYLPKR